MSCRVTVGLRLQSQLNALILRHDFDLARTARKAASANRRGALRLDVHDEQLRERDNAASRSTTSDSSSSNDSNSSSNGIMLRSFSMAVGVKGDELEETLFNDRGKEQPWIRISPRGSTRRMPLIQ
jgi:hypothetical protein